jgi:hypothetical protein
MTKPPASASGRCGGARARPDEASDEVSEKMQRARRTIVEAAVYRDDGRWVVELEGHGTVPVDQLGYQCREAARAAATLLVEPSEPSSTSHVIARLRNPVLPPDGATRPSEPSRVMKNADWYLAYPGAVEHVAFGDFVVHDLVKVFETVPHDVLAIAAYGLRPSDTAAVLPREELARHAHFAVDAAGIHMVREIRRAGESMAATVRGTPQLWLPVITHRELAARVDEATRV